MDKLIYQDTPVANLADVKQGIIDYSVTPVFVFKFVLLHNYLLGFSKVKFFP